MCGRLIVKDSKKIDFIYYLISICIAIICAMLPMILGDLSRQYRLLVSSIVIVFAIVVLIKLIIIGGKAINYRSDRGQKPEKKINIRKVEIIITIISIIVTFAGICFTTILLIKPPPPPEQVRIIKVILTCPGSPVPVGGGIQANLQCGDITAGGVKIIVFNPQSDAREYILGGNVIYPDRMGNSFSCNIDNIQREEKKVLLSCSKINKAK